MRQPGRTVRPVHCLNPGAPPHGGQGFEGPGVSECPFGLVQGSYQNLRSNLVSVALSRNINPVYPFTPEYNGTILFYYVCNHIRSITCFL